jgi:uncharacterized membrane protein
MHQFPFIFLLFFFVGSILGLIAFATTRRIESLLKSFPLNELTSRIYQLEKKVAELQKLLTTAGATPASAASDSSVPAQAPTSAAPPTPAVPAETPKPQPPPAPGISPQPAPPILLPRPVPPPPKLSKEPSASDLEALIGGRWFNRIGIIALLFAVSYFLKLAFDNNWIGPAGRVAIGIFLGTLMLPWSQWLLSRGYTYFSEGIAGLGEATLFVSVWAGCQYYTLFTRQTGFAALVLVTIVMAFLALRRGSERIAFLSLLGGLLTPALMSTGKNEQVMLFSYLLCLGAAALIISWRRNWQSLLPLIFVGSHLYFWQWYDSFYRRALFLDRTIFFATLFFLLYAIIPALRAFRHASLTVKDLLLVAANAVAYSTALYILLWPADRWPLTLLFLLLAAGHLTVAGILPDSSSSGSPLPRFLYLGLAVTFFTFAIPTKFDGNTITLAFALEGGALAWVGFRSHGALLRPAGYILLTTSAFRLFLQPPPADTFLWNERFASYLVLIAGLVAPLWAASSPDPSSRAESAERAFRVPHASPGRGIPLSSSLAAASESVDAEIASLSVAANFFAVLALSLEFWDYFGRGNVSFDHSLAQHLAISILWTCYAAALITFGLLRGSALLRWQALVLLGVVVVKVFLYDLASLDRVYRILSFFILGSALLAVSFLYTRKQSRDRPSL